MKKIVIACDSFKGCLTSAEVADACEEGIKYADPGCLTVKIPVGDGGEGTARALTAAMHGHTVACRVADPLMRPVEAGYGISADGTTAVMEMAGASGLPLLAADERDPWLTSTYGTGQMIMDAITRGCRKILIGIGGSATNDGGMGMLRALGYRFLDATGRELDGCGASLGRVYAIDGSGVPPEVRATRFEVACDVTNPLYGPDGAAHIFARQKGADDDMIARLDDGLRNYARVIAASGRPAVDSVPGAGAAGGLGAAFIAFLDGRLRPGIELVLDAVGFDEKLEGADLVITGEGRLDSQTCMGKTPWGILKRATRSAIPVVAIGGAVDDTAALNAAGFLAAVCVQQRALPLDAAMQPDTARRAISATAGQLTRIMNLNLSQS